MYEKGLIIEGQVHSACLTQLTDHWSLYTYDIAKKEAIIATALITTRHTESIEDISFAPIGRDEPYRVIISEDPIGFSGGSINLHSYVGNNPVNQIDPLGLMRKPGNGSPFLAHVIYFFNQDHDWGKIGFGALGAAEGIQTIAFGGTVIAGTAILTKSPTLTAVIGAEMIPVFWAGVEKTKHGYEMIKEGINGHERSNVQSPCHEK